MVQNDLQWSCWFVFHPMGGSTVRSCRESAPEKIFLACQTYSTSHFRIRTFFDGVQGETKTRSSL